ncbi:hypothetical protein MTO96_044539 [Rhipicephalus appendiculatus]
MCPVDFLSLSAKLSSLTHLQDIRIRLTAKKYDANFSKGMYLLGQVPILSRLYVHADFCIESLLAGLQENQTLTELTLEPAISDVNILTKLWCFLEKHLRCVRLRISVDRNVTIDPSVELTILEGIIRHRSVQALVLSESTIGFSASLRIADALAESNLKELNLEGCKIHCDAIPRFVRAIQCLKKRKTFRELNLGAVIGTGQQQRDMCVLVQKTNVLQWMTLAFNEYHIDNFVGLPLYNINLKHIVKLCLSLGDGACPDSVLHTLKQKLESLESFSLESDLVISKMGGSFLAHIIRQNKFLKVLRLRGRTAPSGSIQMLRALADSDSVLLLTIERWNLTEKVAYAFFQMLLRNGSLRRLEFYWKDIMDYKIFKHHLADGLSFNKFVVVLKMFKGELRDELVDRDFQLLEYLRRNEMMLVWAMDAAIKDGMQQEGLAIAELLDICELPLDLFQRTSDFSPRTAANLVRETLMATRTFYYALRSAFPGDPNNMLTLEASRLIRSLILSMQNPVMTTLGPELASAL